MKFNVKKLTSLLTASLLTAGGLVGLSALPASADANAPATYLDYESQSHVSCGGCLGFEDTDLTNSVVDRDWSTWADYVNDGPTGGDSTFGNMMIKSTKGNGASVVTIATLNASSSAVSSTTRTITMKFKAPASGKPVRLDLKTDGYWPVISATANEQTTGNWQTLTFEFASSENFGYAYNRVALAYDPASTTAAVAPNDVMFIDNVSFNGGAPSSAPVVLNPTSTLIDFTTANYSLGSLDNSVATLATPPTSKTTCSTAVKITKGTSPANLYSVARVAQYTDRKLLSSTGSTMTVNMYAPAAGKTVLFKIAEANTIPGLEKTVITTLGWQSVSLDFSTSVSTNPYNATWDSSKNYTDLFVAVDFTENGSTLDYYFDDFAFNGATTPALGNTVVSCTSQDMDIRLVSSQKNTATDAYQWTGCGASWCANNQYFMKMVDAGSSTTLNYVVTEHGTSTPVVGATVHLRMNTGYSGSNATWTSGGATFGAVSGSNGNDAGFIPATTNSSGEVSFTFANTNTNGEASRTLNNANPYPAGCDSPAGQTKGAIEPTITALSSGTVGTLRIDVLWPHVASTTINTAIAAGSDGSDCSTVTTPGATPRKKAWAPTYDPNNKGIYPHIRLEKSFMNEKFDASWWDGVWQYRDADTKAYLKYIPVGSTFALTYLVTDDFGQPYADAPVSLIVNANYSCSKTYFAYEGALIGPDDCAGAGQTELPAKKTDSKGRVTFVLTNTNTSGEAMPADLNGLPNGKELGTNIKPHLVGATREGIDMLFAHFVDASGGAKIVANAKSEPVIGTSQVSSFTFTDENGAAMTGTTVRYYVNGFDSKVGFATTDSQGRVFIRSTNSAGQAGAQVVGVSLNRDGKLPLTSSVTLNWTAPKLAIQVAGSKGSVVVKVAGASGQTVRITIAGKTFSRLVKTENDTFEFAAGAGKKSVKVVVAGKTVSKTVKITK